MRALACAAIAVSVACAEPAASPRAEPMPSASLDVPPLPPQKAPAEKPAVHDAPPPASAEQDDESPLPRDVAAAEREFQEAKAAMARGDLRSARRLFVQSLRHDHATGTLLNLAVCEEQMGDRTNAIRHYDEAEAEATSKGQPDRARLAKERADRLRRGP